MVQLLDFLHHSQMALRRLEKPTIHQGDRLVNPKRTSSPLRLLKNLRRGGLKARLV